MADKSGIRWTQATWNPLAGCSPVSEGCRNCYAARDAHNRLSKNPNPKLQAKYAGLTVVRGRGDRERPVFNGTIHLVPEALDQPLRWKRPRLIFVNSMSDLFHEGVPEQFIDQVFAVMAMAREHTFQVLTKRPERMAWYFNAGEEKLRDRWEQAAVDVSNSPCAAGIIEDIAWPLPNVWLGTSTEDQKTADERIPHLLRCPAAVRWISAEPLLGPIDLEGLDCFPRYDYRPTYEYWRIATGNPNPRPIKIQDGIGWVVAGGESGPGARPMHPDWVRSLRDQCQAAGVPYFFKQWGEWGPDGVRTGKHAAGHELDGQTWEEYPAAAPVPV